MKGIVVWGAFYPIWGRALKNTVRDPCSSNTTTGLRTLEKGRVMNSRDENVDGDQEEMTKTDEFLEKLPGSGELHLGRLSTLF